MLPFIHDVERRATLFLRLTRAKPFIKSSCCGEDLCFTCKTKDHHHGIPCSAMVEATEDMGLCPSCNLSLVKGDGCDWITCYCGHGFYWYEGLRSFRWSLVTPRQKQMVVAGIVRPFVAYLQARVLKTKIQDTILPALEARVVLINIAKHANAMRLVSEYLRWLVWRTRFRNFVRQSFNIRVRVKYILASMPRVKAAMETFAQVMQRQLVRWRLQYVLAEMVAKVKWARHLSSVPPEAKTQLASDVDVLCGLCDIDLSFCTGKVGYASFIVS
ncbi:Aste57867_16733 [Aphanomyces stellatus]|uniref:Aste57867_16733 protein n=1 Tax=Aphanomyces stellatus TaxID=120398 RepID=A0A485L6Y8_9STRA|nr:hypothetical protein As57867_016676 [Aphanomyces stellatus]VFT93502.1 Aste57867_16733 [Aphanomyces stellatus]